VEATEANQGQQKEEGSSSSCLWWYLLHDCLGVGWGRCCFLPQLLGACCPGVCVYG